MMTILQKTVTLYDDHIRQLLSDAILKHIRNKQKVTNINFNGEVPYSVFSKRALQLFQPLVDNVKLSARWADDNPQSGILELYDYDRKDRTRIERKVRDEIGYMERTDRIKFMEIDFKLLGMNYMNYHDAVGISQSLLPTGWTFKWIETKKGVAVLRKPQIQKAV